MFYHANSDVISKPKYFSVLSYGLSKTVGGGNIGGREIQIGGHGPTDNKAATFGGREIQIGDHGPTDNKVGTLGNHETW